MTQLPYYIWNIIFKFAYPYYQQYSLKDLKKALELTCLHHPLFLDLPKYRQSAQSYDTIIPKLYQLNHHRISIFTHLNNIINTNQVKSQQKNNKKLQLKKLKDNLNKQVIQEKSRFENMFSVNDIIVYYKPKQTYQPTLYSRGWRVTNNSNTGVKTYRNRSKGITTTVIPVNSVATFSLETFKPAGRFHQEVTKLPLLDHNKYFTIFYRIIQKNKTSYQIKPIPMILSKIDPLEVVQQLSSRLSLHYYRLLPDIYHPEQLKSYRLTFQQINYDLHKDQLEISRYPKIKLYQPELNDYATVWRSFPHLLKKIYTVIE